MRIRWSAVREQVVVGFAFVVLVVMVAASSGCASPSVTSIRERERLAAQGTVTASVTAEDMSAYILARERQALERANARSLSDYSLALAGAANADAGAALALRYSGELDENQAMFEAELAKQLVMVERVKLLGQTIEAVNAIAAKEATIAKRTFDEFVANELPRIMAEAKAGMATIAEHQRQEALRKEQERAEREAERRKTAEEAARAEEAAAAAEAEARKKADAASPPAEAPPSQSPGPVTPIS
jgi:hypothetical protein